MEPPIQDADCADNHPPEAPPHDTTQPPTEQSRSSDAEEQGDAPPPPPEPQPSFPTDPPPPDAHDFASGEHGAVPEGAAPHDAAPDAQQYGHDTDDEDVTPPARPWPTPLDTTSFQNTTAGLASAAPSSSSQTSDHQPGHGSTADPADRVFPIRSVVSVDNSATTPWPRSSGEFEYSGRPESRFRDSRHSSVSRGESEHTSAPGMKRADTMPAPGGGRSSSVGGGPRPDKANRKSGLSGSISVRSPQPVDYEHGAGGLPMFNDASSIASNDSTAPSENVSFRSQGTNSTHPRAGSEANEPLDEDFMTTRFRHVVTEEGHAILTGRDGTLQRCEDEPIHTPGAVQSFGVLVAVREDAEGCFSARIVSENSKRILGYTPQQLFRLENFLDVFNDDQADNLLDHIDFIRDDEIDPAQNGPEVFSISIRPPKQRSVKLWCAMHISPTHPDLVICEFELEDDHEFPLRASDNMTPSVPEDTLNQNPTLEEFNESTEVGSKPLRVLRSARKRRGEAGAMQVFDIMSQIQEQLANAPNLEKFLKILVGIVKELTGFHRVMIYQFDAAFNGKVVTELVDPAHTRDLYQGLHFPASDIPKQARDLYKVNKVRLLYDRELESARLVCQTLEDLEEPLDLTHSYLRAMSPIHLKYLKNMAVRASMSISINAFDELWGLISCHSYGSAGSRVAFPIRKMCRLIGDTASRNIERLSYASRLQARKLINTMPTDQNPSGYIIASSEDLLKLFDADSGVLAIRGETKILGRMEQSQEALALLEYLRVKNFTSVLTTQDITTDLPDLRYPPGFTVLAGMLYVPLSTGGQDFIVFFRKGQIKEVKWAGNPYEKIIKEGTAGYLEPRQSFQVWHETVVGKCREWSEEQVETAAVLCLVYGKFIEVWRQKEAALKSSRLTRLLLANSAHEVRTPLNAIINYLEIALEGSLDQETRDNLAKSHSASKSLIYVINDLLDLTNTEEGLELIKDEILDLPVCLQEATEPFKSDAKRKGIGYEVIEHVGLPRWVHGDYRRVRQAVANVTANAVQHTVKGSVKVEYYVAEVTGTKMRLEIVVQDTGRGMTSDQLDALFRAMEQVDADEPSLEGTEENKKEDKDSEGGEGLSLGLGLAVVARIVRNMDGQMRLKSDPGKGTRFVIQLPFEIPTDQVIEDAQGAETREASTHSSVPSVSKTMPPSQTGELTLVQSGGSTTNYQTPNSLGEPRTMDERDSISSLRSVASKNSAISKGSARSNASNKSDADRLIDAIQSPLAIGDDNTEAESAQRSHAGRGPSSLGSSPGRQTASTGLTQHGQSLRRASTDAKTQEMSRMQGESGAVQEPGTRKVAGNKTPIRPVKVPDQYSDAPSAPQTDPESGVLFELPASPGKQQAAPTQAPEGPTKLRVLIAEDDPINMKILRKRLEKAGHTVTHAVNGEDCASVYSEGPDSFDVILMDMQMPIVDGLTSTKMIRAFEKSDGCQALSPLVRPLGRTPVFAVSASLVEKDRNTYVDAGFDGWILKPIDFKRLHTLLDGIQDDEARDACRYVPGQWERGGWFSRKADSQASSAPAGAAPDEVPHDAAPPDEPTPAEE